MLSKIAKKLLPQDPSLIMLIKLMAGEIQHIWEDFTKIRMDFKIISIWEGGKQSKPVA